MALPMLLLISCSKDEPTSEYDGIEEYGKYKKYYDALFNTSWKVEEMRGWDYQDGNLTKEYDDLQEAFDRFGGDEMIITFTNKINPNKRVLDVVCNLWPNAETRAWWIETPDEDYDQDVTNCPELAIVYKGYINGEYARLHIFSGPIAEFTPNRIVMDCSYSDVLGLKNRFRVVLTRVANPSQDNNSPSK